MQPFIQLNATKYTYQNDGQHLEGNSGIFGVII